MWKTAPNINTSIIYTYIITHIKMFPKVGLLRGDLGRRKRKKNDRVNNTEMYHICAGTRYNERHENCKQGWGERIRKNSSCK
jgi:hypothetical protein